MEYDRHVVKQLRAERDCVYTSGGGLAQSDAWLRPRQGIGGGVPEAAMKYLITSYLSPAASAVLRHKDVQEPSRTREESGR
jgi:hypothetical protein